MSPSILQFVTITILLSSHLANAQTNSSTPFPVSSVPVSSLPSGSTSTLPSPSVSLLSTNPTAVPLSKIVSFESSSPTPALASTPASGSVPTFIPKAPPLPDASKVIPSNYPKLDTVPPTDSAEVQQWIAEVQSSGIEIPDFSPTVAGGCPANPGPATDPTRCWWTCGGCTRQSDVTSCPTKGTWGLTYDDGPAYYTPNLLQYLDEHSLKSTFFAIGSRCAQFPHFLQNEYMSQHQISVHTWSHAAPLTTLTTEQVIAELGWSKKVIRDVLGVTPNTMRPPYGDIDDRVRAISLAMGLIPIMWTSINATATFDTGDYNIHGGTISAPQVLSNWENIMANVATRDTGFIVLEHDLYEETVQIATGYILPDALARTSPKLTLQPVITCLGQPLANAYIETNDNTTNPPPVTYSLNPSSTSTTGSGAKGTSQSGASSLRSLPDMAIFGLLSLITGFVIVF